LKIKSKNKLRFADWVSKIANAPLIAMPAFLLLNYSSPPGTDFIKITLLCFIFGSIIPVIVVAAWISRHHKLRDWSKEYDVPNREERKIPLTFIVASYLTGSILLYYFNAPLVTTGLMFCYFSTTLLVLFISLYWKISLHTMGVSGPAAALIFAFGPIGAVYALILSVVMWSRVYLKRHTMSQVIAGASVGFILTAIQLWAMFNAAHKPSDVYPLLWLIPAFIGPAILLSVTGFLNSRGLHDGYTRKIFHFIAFISIAVFLKYAPSDVTVISIVIGMIYLLVSCFSGKGFLWFDGMARKSDAPNEKLYVILPMASTVAGLGASWALFGHPFVEIGMLCVAIGDAVAEPVGVRWGRHKFKVYSLTGKMSQRSIEGSLSVFLACALIIFLVSGSVTVSLLIGFSLSIIEAISPRGTDNFTVLAGASALLWLSGVMP